ncbi:hypothetical protein ACIQAA_16685 [Neobacillus sp. NPDC093182]|uniref:hypothetical protein n=1 Tax=Neobacillus sp. NPDC093182 TaxID=3364297 RepID=UPI0038019818
MNFDTKHLVRWGIPGWILIMMLGPYIFFSYQQEIKEMSKTINVLALGAFLTIIGVPLGYLLNQIHHSITWVLVRVKILNGMYKKGTWDDYFEKELKLDEIFFKDEIGAKKKERYTYLLSRKHELGGVTVSLGLSSIVILIFKISEKINGAWSWIYLAVVIILFLIILLSRNYSSRNIDKYYKHYLESIDNPNNSN